MTATVYLYFEVDVLLLNATSGDPFRHGSLVYKYKQLLALCNVNVLPKDISLIPVERRRGCSTGVKCGEERKRYKQQFHLSSWGIFDL